MVHQLTLQGPIIANIDGGLSALLSGLGGVLGGLVEVVTGLLGSVTSLLNGLGLGLLGNIL